MLTSEDLISQTVVAIIIAEIEALASVLVLNLEP
jgi:hypothetical protein